MNNPKIALPSSNNFYLSRHPVHTGRGLRFNKRELGLKTVIVLFAKGNQQAKEQKICEEHPVQDL